MNLYFDGKAEPNPGKGSAGAVLFNENGQEVFRIGKYLPQTTNNQGTHTRTHAHTRTRTHARTRTHQRQRVNRAEI